ncbi:MAG: hypothetical protein ACTSRZ_15100 [Promethearchaeota archaeon]
MTVATIYALRINATLKNIAPLHIYSTRSFKIRNTTIIRSDYPQGQNFRGAFGYLFLEMGSKLSETYEDGHPVIYYRDGLPIHKKDDGILLPSVLIENNRPRTVYLCNLCKNKFNYPVYLDTINGISMNQYTVQHFFRTNVITEGHLFRFSAIIKMTKNGINADAKDIARDFIAAVMYGNKNGLYIGKRNSKDLGKVEVNNINIEMIAQKDIEKRASEIASIIKKNNGKFSIHLLSDTIAPFPLTQNEIINSIKKTLKFFVPNYPKFDNPTIMPIGGNPPSFKTTIKFLDYKISKGIPRFLSAQAISRGTIFKYKITKESDEFYFGLAACETLMGIGKRTSFGKGEFIVE